MTTTEGAFYWPPLQNLPNFDVLVFRNAQDVVDYAVSAGNATTVSVADTNVGINYYPVFTSTGAGQKALLFDTITTPFSYLPSTGTITVSGYDIRATTTPSTISGSGLNVTYKNNNENGLQQFIVSTGLGPVTMIEMGEFYFTTYVISDFNSELRFRSASSAQRSITNTFYNLNDTSAVAGGAAQGRIYSDTANTYIEGFVGNHSIIGTENSTVSSRQLFNFGSSSANFYSPNITLNLANNFNVGQGAGDTSNVIIGYSTPRTIVYNTSSNNTIIGSVAGTNLNNVAAANNTFVGQSSGQAVTNATNNTFIGRAAGQQTLTGIQNTFIGASSGFLTSGASQGTGNNNVCLGYQSGFGMITTARENTLIGTNAGNAVTIGNSNTIVGYNSGVGLTSGGGNVFIGELSGNQTPASAGTSGFNVCVGSSSGSAMITSANNNTFVGKNAGNIVTTGTNNTCIGADSDPLTATTSNTIAIGTVTETMFIQGGFNYRIGTNITATITLSAPLSQFFSVAMTAAAQVITLPAPSTASVKGAYVVFKRKTNTTAYTIGAGANSMMPVNSITSAATISVGTSTFNIQLICDGIFWSVIQQA